MKAAIPTNDGIMMANYFEQAKGFLIFNIELGKVVKEELIWNKAGYVADSPDGFLAPVKECSAVFADSITDSLKTFLNNKGIDLIQSKDSIITNVIIHYLENEVGKAADYCCCP
jgi:predicted Fe-Mo cluster-binding NifX family protein